MTGCRVAQDSSLQIDEEIGGGHEMLFEFAAKRAIESSEDQRGVVGVRGLADERHFEHGSNEGRRNTVSGDIGDENSEPFIINGKKIIEVSGDSAHGN